MALAAQVACAGRPTITPLAFVSGSSRDTAALGARVSQVVSGGSWTAGPSSGHYRIVVSSDGAVDNHYTIVVQWMERSASARDLALVFSVDLKSLGTRWYSMLDPDLRWSRGRWILTLDASDAPLMPAMHRATFELGGPGYIRER
jgi:hypothetical protein